MLLTIVPSTVFVKAESQSMSKEFSKVLTNGKLVLNYAKPTSMDDEMLWIAIENFALNNDSFLLAYNTFTEDFSKAELKMFTATGNEETHIVDVVWNYDKDILEASKSIVENFPDEWATYISLELSDLEFINYCVHNKPIHNNYNGALANYSSKLKDAVGGSNFYFEVQLHGQGAPLFYTTNGGTARLMHNNIGYYAAGGINTKANHAIYIPESTADTKEALMAAAQKRIDDYIGKNIIKITDSGETVSDFYEKELSTYEANLADSIAKLDEVRALLAVEKAKEESIRDQNLIDYYTRDIDSCEKFIDLIAAEQQKEKPGYIELDEENGITDTASMIGYAYNSKIDFINEFEEGGIYHFLNDAAGEYVFNLEVLEKSETYEFVIIKDDTKLSVPTYASTDFKSNVSVSTDSSEVPLDTVIKVEKITHGEEHERICGTLEIKDGEIFDIKLYSGSLDDYITELKNGKFKVRLPIKNEYKGKELVVYYVDANGNKTKYNVTVKNNFAFFETDHFSIYTLTTVSDDIQALPSSPEDNTKLPKPEDNITIPSTGDNSNITLWFMILFASLIGLIGIFYTGKKKEHN